MKESVTYQAILEEGSAKGEAAGKIEGERNVVIRLATKKFGPPDANALFTLHAMTDIDRIELLADRLLEARSWDELLNT